MNVNERLANINRIADNRDNRIAQEREDKQNELEELINRIETKAQAVFPDLFKVAETLVARGYYLGDKSAWDQSPTFCTDGIGHCLGFYLASGNPFLGAKGSMPVAFGNQGGGCCGTDFKIDKTGKVIRYNFEHYWCKKKMKDFETGLDDFVTRFYAWVDGLK